MVHMVAEVELGQWPAEVVGEWTHELVDSLPEGNLRYELLDGMLLVSPTPRLRHQVAAARLFKLLDAACPPDHIVLFAPVDWRPDGRTSLEPDLLVVRRDRLGEKNIVEVLTIAVEVLSPSSVRIDRLLKSARYAEGGISQYWIVDPQVPSVEIFDLHDGAYQLVASGRDGETVEVPAPFEVSVVPAALITI